MTTKRQRLATALGAAGLAVLLAAGGCSGSDTRSASDAGGPGLVRKEGAAEAPAQPGAAADTPADTPADLRVGQRSVIYTGSITVRVDDVDAAAARATSIATAAGGFVGGDRRSSNTKNAEAHLELRVPAGRFMKVVDDLAALGRPEHREISTEDVTEQVVDLDARIATQQARVRSGRRLLAEAKNLSDLIALENELAKREADLASLEAKKRRLADLTALSTITAVLLGPQAKSPDDEPQTGFLAGLRGGWKAFVASVQLLLTVLGALLPFLVVLGVPIAVIVLVRRGRRDRKAMTTASPGAEGASTPLVAAGGAHTAVPQPAAASTAPAPAPRSGEP